MVKFSRGQLIQYKPYHGAANPTTPQSQGRIVDPIIDTTNTFTGAYLVQNGNRQSQRMEQLVREEDIVMSLDPLMQ